MLSKRRGIKIQVRIVQEENYLISMSWRSRKDIDLMGLVRASTFSALPGLFCSSVFAYMSFPGTDVHKNNYQEIQVRSNA